MPTPGDEVSQKGLQQVSNFWQKVSQKALLKSANQVSLINVAPKHKLQIGELAELG